MRELNQIYKAGYLAALAGRPVPQNAPPAWLRGYQDCQRSLPQNRGQLADKEFNSGDN